jgi:Leucine-rich repeat (LRR) protein
MCQWCAVSSRHRVEVASDVCSELYIDATYIESTIPTTFTNLRNVLTLSMQRNYNLHGPIPSLAGMANLNLLLLNHNRLNSSLRTCVRRGHYHLYIRVTCMRVSSAASDFGALTSLAHLELSNNDLSGTLPESMSQLQALWGV